MTLGRRIKQIRKENGDLTQTEFAEKLGSTLGAISKYEVDRVTPNDVFIQHLCKLFSVSEHWLKTGEGEMYVPVTEDDKFAEALGSLLISENEQIKEIITKAMELDDRDLSIIQVLVDRLLESKHEKK